MFLKRLKRMAETVGLACFVLLALYGALSIMRGEPVWAGWRAADVVPAPAEAPEDAPARAPHRSDGDTWDGATVPLVVNYQGTLHDAEGNPFTGYYTMTFRVYTDVIAPITSSVWSEQHLSVTVRGGRFNVLLGNVEPISNPIPADLFNDPDRFVGVQVAGYDEMVPRQRFASVPYAFHAFYATHAMTATYAIYATDANALRAPNGNPASATTIDNNGNIVVYGALTASGPISSSSLNLVEKATSAATEAADNSNTLATKGYVDNTWPDGNYCILQAGGSCPDGFASGYMCLDTEDDDNGDSVGGSIGDSMVNAPAGCGGNSAAGRVRIRFCCKQ